MTHRLGTDLNIGPTPNIMSSHFFNDDYPRKEIKAASTIKLKPLKNGLEAGAKLILDNRCWWSMMKMSVLNFKRFRINSFSVEIVN